MVDATISTPFARMERKSHLILSTCIVGTQRLGSDVVLISGAAETDPGADNRERRGTDHDSLHSSVTGGPDSPEVDPDGNRPSEQDKQCESTFPSTTPPARIEIDIRCHPRTKTTPYIVGHFPSPAFLPSSPRLGNFPSSRRFWGSSGRNPWHGRQASRLLPSTVAPGRRRGGFPLPPPPSLSMFQKRELSSSPDLSRSGCTVYF